MRYFNTTISPRHVGYLVQGPDSYSYHHGVDSQKNDAADLAVFDILFGTFQNPASHMDTGCYPNATYRVADMLVGRDINANHQASSVDTVKGNETSLAFIDQ